MSDLGLTPPTVKFTRVLYASDNFGNNLYSVTLYLTLILTVSLTLALTLTVTLTLSLTLTLTPEP